MKILGLVFVLILSSCSAFGAIDVSYFAGQRNVFVLGANDSDSLGLVNEITGRRNGSMGLSKRFQPLGIESSWYLHGYGLTGPLARFRATGVSVQIRDGFDEGTGWDAQAQVGHAWAGPEMGALSMAFELGLSLRRMGLQIGDQDLSSGLAGGFWGAILSHDLWTLHTEGALMAFSLGSQGRWGKHRDSNSLRLKLSRQFDADSKFKAYFEFYHLHRSFTGSEMTPAGSFVSDVSLNLGLTYSQ